MRHALPYAAAVVMLAISNLFMNLAWYGHLRDRTRPLWKVILANWGIALAEYCPAVPANRLGSTVCSPATLKALQEMLRRAQLAGFAVMGLGARPVIAGRPAG